MLEIPAGKIKFVYKLTKKIYAAKATLRPFSDKHKAFNRKNSVQSVNISDAQIINTGPINIIAGLLLFVF